MIEYLLARYHEIPSYIYEMLLSIFCFVSVLFVTLKGRRAWREVFRLMLAEYIFILYCSTIIFREFKEQPLVKITPFWSYGMPELYVEKLMNLFAFMPIGMMVWLAWKNTRWWKAMFLGLFLSLNIELSQLILKCGCCETDDLIMNTIGCLFGYTAIATASISWKRSICFLN